MYAECTDAVYAVDCFDTWGAQKEKRGGERGAGVKRRHGTLVGNPDRTTARSIFPGIFPEILSVHSNGLLRPGTKKVSKLMQLRQRLVARGVTAC